MAGSLYAHYITYIDPTSFTVSGYPSIISMVIIGGAGSTWGPLVGAVVLVTLPEALRFVGLPSAVAANLRQIIYGSLLGRVNTKAQSVHNERKEDKGGKHHIQLVEAGKDAAEAFEPRKSRSISLRRRYITRSYSQGQSRLVLGGTTKI